IGSLLITGGFILLLLSVFEVSKKLLGIASILLGVLLLIAAIAILILLGLLLITPYVLLFLGIALIILGVILLLLHGSEPKKNNQDKNKHIYERDREICVKKKKDSEFINW
ncbi:MAG TPA: hypothetical protein PKI50_11985, partial [Bacillota bacterium]|nr:hypothetical protein [Bacillota bacterium]